MKMSKTNLWTIGGSLLSAAVVAFLSLAPVPAQAQNPMKAIEEEARKNIEATIKRIQENMKRVMEAQHAAERAAERTARIARMGEEHIVAAGIWSNFVCGRKDSAHLYLKHLQSPKGAGSCSGYQSCLNHAHGWAQKIHGELSAAAKSHDNADFLTTTMEAVRAGYHIYGHTCGRIANSSERMKCFAENIEHGPIGNHVVPPAERKAFSENMKEAIESYDRYFHTPHGPAC